MRHHDNQRNTGLLGAGSAQWMTAGGGILPSEMPEQEYGLMQDFQLWMKLLARDKMVRVTLPGYFNRCGAADRLCAGWWCAWVRSTLPKARCAR
jgi:hypothetical protein